MALHLDIVKVETLIEAMREELGPRKAKFLDGNIKALHAGIEYVEKNVLNK